MRDGSGKRMSPEEQERVKSISGAPKEESLREVSVDPGSRHDTGEADKPAASPMPTPGLRGEE
jgi:hypothetical protein